MTGLENEVGRNGLVIGCAYFLLERPIVLLPGDECVCAGGNVGDFKRAVGASHRKVRMSQDVDEGFHPRVHIAADGERLGLIEGEIFGLTRSNQGKVERLIDSAHAVHVVNHRIAADHMQRLTRAEGQHVRDVLAVLLIEHDRR